MESFSTISMKADCLWAGRVSQKMARREQWQNKWIVVFRNAVYCFKSSADLKANVIFNLRVFQLSVDVDDIQPNILTFTNGLSNIKMGFSTKNELEEVLKGLHNAGVQIQGLEKILVGVKPLKQVKFNDYPDNIDNSNDGNGNPIRGSDEPSLEEQELIAKLEQANLALVSDCKAVGTVELQQDSTSSSSNGNTPVKSHTEISRDGSYTSFKSDDSYATDPKESLEFDPPLNEAQKSRFSLFSSNPVNKPNLGGKFKSLFGKSEEPNETPTPQQPPLEANSNPSTTLFKLKNIFRKAEEPAYDLEVSKTSEGRLSSDLDSFELHEAECSLHDFNIPTELQPEILEEKIDQDEHIVKSDPVIKKASDLIEEFALTVNYRVDEQEVQFVTKFDPDDIRSFQSVPIPEQATVQLVDLGPCLEQTPQVDKKCDDSFVKCEFEELIELVPPPIELDRISSESEEDSIVVLRDPQDPVPVIQKSRLAHSPIELSPKRPSFKVSELNLFQRAGSNENVDLDPCSIGDEPELEEDSIENEVKVESDIDDFKLLEEEAEKLQKAIEAKAKTLELESNSDLEPGSDTKEQPSFKHTPQSAFRISRSFSGSQTSLKTESFDLGTWPRKTKTLKAEPTNLKPSVSTSSLFDQLNQEKAPKRKQSIKKLFVRKAKERSHSLKRSFRSLRGKKTDQEEDFKTPQQVFEQGNFADFENEGKLGSIHSLSSVSLPIPEEQSESDKDIKSDPEASASFQVGDDEEQVPQKQESVTNASEVVEEQSPKTEEDSQSNQSEEPQDVPDLTESENKAQEFGDFPSKHQWDQDWAVKFENSFDKDFFGTKRNVSLDSDQDSIGSYHSDEQKSSNQNFEDAFKPQQTDLVKADDKVSFEANFGDSFEPEQPDFEEPKITQDLDQSDNKSFGSFCEKDSSCETDNLGLEQAVQESLEKPEGTECVDEKKESPVPKFEDPFLLHTTSPDPIESGPTFTFYDTFQIEETDEFGQFSDKEIKEPSSDDQSIGKPTFEDAFNPEGDVIHDKLKKESSQESHFEENQLQGFESNFELDNSVNKTESEIDTKTEGFQDSFNPDLGKSEVPTLPDIDKTSSHTEEEPGDISLESFQGEEEIEQSTNFTEDIVDHGEVFQENCLKEDFQENTEDKGNKSPSRDSSTSENLHSEDIKENQVYSETSTQDKVVVTVDGDSSSEECINDKLRLEIPNDQNVQENFEVEQDLEADSKRKEFVPSFEKSPKSLRTHSREPSDSGDSFHRFEAHFQGDGISIESDPFKEDPFANEIIREEPDLPETQYSGTKPRLSLEPVKEEESIDLSDKEVRKTGTKPKDPLPVSSVPARNTKPRASRHYDIQTSSDSDSETDIRPKPRRKNRPSNPQHQNEDRLHVPKTQSVLKLRSRSGTGSSSSESGSLRNSLEQQTVKEKKISFKKAVRGIAKAVSLQDISLSKNKVTDKKFKWFKRKSIGEVSEQSEALQEIKQNQLGLTDTQLWELWKQGQDVQFKVGKSHFYVPSPRRIEIFEKSEEIEITEDTLEEKRDERDPDFSRFSTSDKSYKPESDHKNQDSPAPKDSFEDNFKAEFEANFDNANGGKKSDESHLEEDLKSQELDKSVGDPKVEQANSSGFDSDPVQQTEKESDNLPPESVNQEVHIDHTEASIELRQNIEEDTDISKSEEIFKDCESLSDVSDLDDPEQFLSIQTSPVKEGVVLKNFASPLIQSPNQKASEGYSSSSSIQSDLVFVPKARARSNSLEIAHTRRFVKTRKDDQFSDLSPNLQESSSSITTEDSDTFYSLSSEVEGKVVRFSNPDISNTGFLSEDDEDTLQSTSSTEQGYQAKDKMNHSQSRSRHSMVDYYDHHHHDVKSSHKTPLKTRSKSASPLKRLKNLFKGQPAPPVVKLHENPLDPKRLNHNPIFLEDEMQDNSEYDPSKEQYRPRSGIPDPLIDQEPYKTTSGRQPVARGKRNPKAKLLATSFSRSDPTPIHIDALSSEDSTYTRASNLASRYPEIQRSQRTRPRYNDDSTDSELDYPRGHNHQNRFIHRPKLVKKPQTEPIVGTETVSGRDSLEDRYGSDTGVIDFDKDDLEDEDDEYSLQTSSSVVKEDEVASADEFQPAPDVIPDQSSVQYYYSSSDEPNMGQGEESILQEFQPNSLDSSPKSSVVMDPSKTLDMDDLPLEESQTPPLRERSASLPRMDSPDGRSPSIGSGGSIRKRGKRIQRSDSERSSKRKGKKITPPDTPPLIKGMLEVTLSPESRWRRRYLTIQDGLLLIFPKAESKLATARVKLPHHGLHSADAETGKPFSFKLTRKSKTTLYMKADTVAEFGGWTQTLTAEIQRLSANTQIEDTQPPRQDRVSLRDSRDFDEDDQPPLDLSSLGPASFVEDSTSTLSLPKQPRTPVPTPRTSSASPLTTQSTPLEQYQAEPQVRHQIPETADQAESVEVDPVIETSFPVKEVEIEESPPDSMIPNQEDEKEPLPYDSLEIANMERDRNERSLSPETQPKIYINTSGQWVVEEEQENGSLHVAKPVQAVSEDSMAFDDDIPDEWKENNSLPIRRCVPVEDPGTSSSGEESQCQVTPGVIMDVIEELDEERTASEDDLLDQQRHYVHDKSASPPRRMYSTSPTGRITSPELVQQVEKSFVSGNTITTTRTTTAYYEDNDTMNHRQIMRNQQHKPVAKPLTSAALQPMSPETASTFAPRHFHEFDIHNDSNHHNHHQHHSNKTSPSPPSSRSRSSSRQMFPSHHNHQSRLSEERISPDTITSNDSGVVDPHDEIFSPNGSTQGQHIGLTSLHGSNSNICVKNIAKFWEDVSKKLEGPEGDDQNMSKKWFSMPDLKMKKTHGARKVRYEDQPLPPVLYEDEYEDDQESAHFQETPRQGREARHSVSGPSEAIKDEYTRPIIRSDYEVDDRGVCALVPIRERKKLFETLASSAQRSKMKQWSSMPSLDIPKNKDFYQRHNYGQYSRQYQPAPITPTGPILDTLYSKKQPTTCEDRVTSANLYHAKPAPIIPDYSHSHKSVSKESSDDYELTPLRDRMRAFQSPEKEPVSKPVVSMPKTVSPSVKPTQPPPVSVASVLPIPQIHERKSSPTANLHHARPYELEAPNRHISEDDAASLADSVASSHTSSSTVISASKINGYSPNAHQTLIPTYSWNDESNGEIYNDKMDHNEILYVVENGQEYPLESVSKRKSLFQSTDNIHDQSLMRHPGLTMPKDIMKSEPMLLTEQKVREYRQSQYDLIAHSDESEDLEDQEILDQYDELVRKSHAATLEDRKYTIKASKVPYIEEEQDVLQKINVVRAMKEKFLVG